MVIPDYQSLMLPLLEFAQDGKEHSVGDAEDYLAGKFGLSAQDKIALLPSKRAFIFENRVRWARTYLKKAAFVEYPERGFLKITKRGLEVLSRKPNVMDNKFLQQFPEFIEFRHTHKGEDKMALFGGEENTQTPEESLEFGFQKLNQELARELLAKVKTASPKFFEKLVVELLVKMGYGGPSKDAGQVTSRSGDEGIDGLINEDKLGLDVVYIQAKRWEGVVGRPEIMKFVGALQGKRAKKGVFITTSRFTDDATNYAWSVDCKIVLINGEELAELMIEFNVGVSEEAYYSVKKIDSDYFSEE